MSATLFTADLKDIRFVLFEQLESESTLGSFYEEYNEESAAEFLESAHEMAQSVLHPINGPGDHQGCRYDTNEKSVITPDGYKEAWETLAENGFFQISAPVEYEGLGMPHVLDMAIGEMFTGACMAFALYPGLSRSAASLLREYGDAHNKDLIISKLYSGEWAGTMCLTEAGAGSDVGANAAKAVKVSEDTYELTGEKIFISSGDHDLTENIIHLVLARTPGAEDGTKGLSIFLVPKFIFDADGNLGERNGIFVSGIEEKMGIHGSATCTLALGADRKCVGYLLGNEQQGIEIMFHMMNEARLEVGVQGLSGASAAYQYAKHYAKERIQGTDIRKFGQKDAPKVAINKHPDVRRMLMNQKVLVETMRSFIYTVAHQIDTYLHTDDPTLKRNLKGQIDLMTPIVKSYCSDRGFESAVLGLQTFGGYGYCSEYPVEQLVRDSKIASIYEGTNGIQAMDLLGRKMRKANGALFMTWMQEVQKEVSAAKAHDSITAEADAVNKALQFLGQSAMHLGGVAQGGNIAGSMLQAMPFLDQFGNVVLANHALRQARIAIEKGDDSNFYKGKVLNLKFYVNNILPQSVALGKQITSKDESCLDEALFQ
ncbi:MAG: acyl-CoA dehydrogenase [Myxococcota bacterium]